MPRKKKDAGTTTIIRKEVIEGDALEAGAEPQPTVDDADIAAFMKALGPTLKKISVYRIKENGVPEHVASEVPPNVCNESWIQMEYGEGTYFLIMRDENGEQLAQRTLHIAPPGLTQRLEIARRRAELEKLSAGGNSAGPSGEIQVQLLREELASQRQVMLELIRALATREPTAPQGSSIQDLMQAFQLAHQTMSPLAAFDKIAEVFKTGVELGASGGVPEKGWGGILKDVITEIPQVLNQMKSQPIQNVPQPRPAVPQPVPQPAGQPAAQPPAGDLPVDQPTLELLRRGIQYLKAKARAGKEVGLWVDLIVQNLEEQQWLPFAELVEMPFEDIAKATDPEILQPIYRPWFEALFAGVKDALSSRVDAGDDDGAGDAPPDGEPGA